jgi:hypothetical protein
MVGVSAPAAVPATSGKIGVGEKNEKQASRSLYEAGGVSVKSAAAPSGRRTVRCLDERMMHTPRSAP